MHSPLACFRYLYSVTAQMPSHAASAILDGERLAAPLEAGGMLWVEFPVVLWKTLCHTLCRRVFERKSSNGGLLGVIFAHIID